MSEAVRRDRRRFLKHATLAAAALASAPVVAFAQSKSKAAKPAPKAAPAAPATPPAGANAPTPISDDAKALASIVQRRYGQHLTSAQLEAVTRQIDGSVQSGRRLKDVKFANGDEPDFTFIP